MNQLGETGPGLVKVTVPTTRACGEEEEVRSEKCAAAESEYPAKMMTSGRARFDLEISTFPKFPQKKDLSGPVDALGAQRYKHVAEAFESSESRTARQAKA